VPAQLGVVVQPPQRGDREDQVAPAGGPHPLQLVDGLRAVERVVPGVRAVRGLREVAAGAAVQRQQPVVAAGDHEHAGAGRDQAGDGAGQLLQHRVVLPPGGGRRRHCGPLAQQALHLAQAALQVGHGVPQQPELLRAGAAAPAGHAASRRR
jgi:hypothetical protein